MYNALDWSTDNCPVGLTMEIIGERWTVVVLREVFNGIRRFDDMRTRTHVPRQVLSNRLATLVDHGILRRTPYQEPGARQRFEYRLTEKGLDLYPVLIAIRDWGDKHLTGAEGSPVEVTHRECGALVHTEVRCAAGHAVTPRDAVPRPGPGAQRRNLGRDQPA
ncbi:helix-turn-helix transcriptional regulator [Kribbella sp. NBC_01505]|uniref:winged helix-turn-helix transcriptional regulator n=1 Tax=Kribbella sp. NBC_01505 TaxID=2903580 RepID=UPI0038647C5E